ncbi:MAG: hypothetical protein ABSG15_08390 [FCB group bacterium]|jgi:hypothetical protein
MGNFEIEPGENKIDTWTIMYVPPYGGKYNGKLTVTNKRLIYEAKYEATVLGTLVASSPFAPNSLGVSILPKDSITYVETTKSFLSKKVIVNMKNGEKHIFDYGALGVDKVEAAINAR